MNNKNDFMLGEKKAVKEYAVFFKEQQKYYSHRKDGIPIKILIKFFEEQKSLWENKRQSAFTRGALVRINQSLEGMLKIAEKEYK